jgi:flagellar biogenesis protein FliO
MNFLEQFAGFTACTSGDTAKQTLALLVALGIIVGGIFFLRQWNKDVGDGFSNSKAGKVLFNVIAFPVIVFVAVFSYAVISPWCS